MWSMELWVTPWRGRGVHNKVLHVEAPSRGPTPYLFLIEKVPVPRVELAPQQSEQ